MDHVQSNMLANQGSAPVASQTVSTTSAGGRYRRPRIVTIGTATEVVQQNSTGRDSDGSSGWYVWGS